MSQPISRSLLVAFLAVLASGCAETDTSQMHNGPIFKGHTGRVHSIAFSPDGETLLSATLADGIRYWRIKTGQELAHIKSHLGGELYSVWDVKFLPNGTSAASSGQDKAVEVFDLSGQRPVQRFVGHPYGVNSIALSPAGDRVLSAGQQGTVILWDIAEEKALCHFSGHDAMYAVVEAIYSPDGLTAITASQDGKLITWDVNGCKLLKSLGGMSYQGGPVAINQMHNVAISRERVLDSKNLVVWELDSGRELRKLIGHKDGVNAVAMSPDGLIAASGGNDKCVRVWNVQTGALLRSIQFPTDVWSVTFSPVGKSIAVGGDDGTVFLVELQ